jgi:hypothetical protein
MAFTLAKSSAVAQRTAAKGVARPARVAVAARRPVKVQASAQPEQVCLSLLLPGNPGF